MTDVPELTTSQEEADTKYLFVVPIEEMMDSQVSVYSLLIVIYHYMPYTLQNILTWICL